MKLKQPNCSNVSKNYFFEAEKCSGILVIVRDGCDPLQLKFSEKIRIEVNFDSHISDPEIFSADKQNEGENTAVLDSLPHSEIITDKAESSYTLWQESSETLSSSTLGNDGFLVSDAELDSGRCEFSESGHVGTDSAIKPRQSVSNNVNGIHSDLESNNRSNSEADIIDTDPKEHYPNSDPYYHRTLRKRGWKMTTLSSDELEDEREKEIEVPVVDINFVTDNHRSRQLRSSSRLRSELKRGKLTRAVTKQKEIEDSLANINMKKKEPVDKKSKKLKKKCLSINPHHEKQRKRSELEKTNVVAKIMKRENSDSIVQEDKGIEEISSTLFSDEEDLDTFKEEDNFTDKTESIDHRSMSKKIKTRNRKRKLLLEKDVKCTYCGVTFETKLDFFNHRRDKGSSYTCKICGKTEPFEGFLMVHMQTHKPQKGHLPDDEDNNDGNSEKVLKRKFKMKCDVCGLVVSSLDSLKTHMMNHTAEFPYKCCVCDNQKFCSLSSLHYHLEGHKSAERIMCKLCNVRFASRAELAKHRLTHEITCALCGEHFPNKTSRNCHYRTGHPNDVLKCSLCFRLFATEADYQKHLLYHRKRKKAQCPECGVVVVKLKDHMTVHSKKDDDKMFACDQCSLRFKYKSTLDKHLLTHTGERPYACNKCEKRFRSNGELRKHLLTHTLERHFVCEVCGKRCALRSNLAMHMRMHNDTRQYACTFCSQSFNYKNSLQIHIKAKHSNQQQSSFNCPHCAQMFQDNALLTSHILTQHSEVKVCDDVIKSLPPATTSASQRQDLSQVASQLEEPSFSSFISDQLQGYHDNMNPNHHNTLHMTNSTLDLQSLDTASSLLPPPTSNYNPNSQIATSGLEPMARGEMPNYFSRDRISPMVHNPNMLPVSPALHLLPSMRMDMPSMRTDMPYSNSFNSINTLPHVHSHPPPSIGLVEAVVAPVSTRSLQVQGSTSLDDQVQYSVYQKL